MVSPYLKRPLRSYQQALEDRANRRVPQPGVPVSAERRTPVELRREPDSRIEKDKRERERERETESAA